MAIGAVLLLILGAAVLLSGCSGTEKKDEELTEEEIIEGIHEDEAENSGALVVEGALVACSAMGEAVSVSHIIKEDDGITIQGGLELNHKDINFEPFIRCSNAEDKQCSKDIEDEEWKDYDETSGVNGKYSLLKERSYMFCLHGGGMVYLSDNGQRLPDLEEAFEGAGGVTSQMMSDFGWQVSETELIKINNMLNDYGITDMKSIRLFMATCAHESGKGSLSVEGLNKDGSTVGTYKKTERGAGYIQITWEDAHMKFLATIPDSFSGADTATYIAENYPWEAAGWFWSSTDAKQTSEKHSLNDYVAKYGDSKGVFLISQYLINGWPDGLDNSVAFNIRDGKVSWTTKNGRVYVNGIDTCRVPNGWDDTSNAYNRENSYDEAIKSFK